MLEAGGVGSGEEETQDADRGDGILGQWSLGFRSRELDLTAEGIFQEQTSEW